jgi:O-acetyl-ADP-ribose deacetylase (regulator of RNase III)
MGRGLALQFRETFPDNFTAYAAACKAGEVKPGKMFVYDLQQLQHPRAIINFPTKRHWKGNSRIEDIKTGLIDLIDVVQKYQLHSIAIPPLGCGLGGLDWEDVKPLIIEAFQPIPEVSVILFEPAGAPPPQ